MNDSDIMHISSPLLYWTQLVLIADINITYESKCSHKNSSTAVVCGKKGLRRYNSQQNMQPSENKESMSHFNAENRAKMPLTSRENYLNTQTDFNF
jgi:hypothetical protein